MSACSSQPSERSNSLQRMLELERQVMMERLQARDSMSQASLPLPPASLRQSSSVQNASIQARRIESYPINPVTSVTKPRQSLPATHPAKLSVDIPAATRRGLPLQEKRDGNTKLRRSTLEATTPPSIKYSSTADMFVASSPSTSDQQSVCQSPSWEAYDRRKKEKKEEKRGREEARKEGRKTRRLSKPPPASSPYMFAQAHAMAAASDASLFQGPSRPRPLSCIDLAGTTSEHTIYRQPRSRAGSFTSLLKAPFDFRRPSIDQSQAAESEFVGGIKLEMERHVAHQQLLDGQSKTDESNIHPALRKHSVPQVVPMTTPSKDGGTKKASNRAYPPITRKPINVQPVQTPPAKISNAEMSKIEKWRARVGFRSAAKTAAPEIKDDLNFSPPPPSSMAIAHDSKPASHNMRPNSRDENRSNTDASSIRLCTPPPEPPRRSSKRNSLLILEGSSSISSVSDSSNSSAFSPLQRPPVSLLYASNDSQNPRKFAPVQNSLPHNRANSPSPTPSWENLQSSVMDTIENTIRPLQEIEQESWNSREWASRQPVYTAGGHSSSSDDSASEGFRSHTTPSTPDTSRPQSEAGFPRENSKHSLRSVQLFDKEYFEDGSVTQPGSSHHRDCQDPIQAAADKVMAALPSLQNENHTSSALYSSQSTEFIHRPLRLRSKGHKASLSTDCAASGGPIGKVFVECCACKYYHDMPSKLYEALVNPQTILSPHDRDEFAGTISMSVKCPWCKHEMKTSCCAGFAAMVYIKERLH